MAVTDQTAQRGPMMLADWGQLVLLGAIWGGSFFFARVAVAEMHPLVLVLFRVAIAAAALQVDRGALVGGVLHVAAPFRGTTLFTLAL